MSPSPKGHLIQRDARDLGCATAGVDAVVIAVPILVPRGKHRIAGMQVLLYKGGHRVFSLFDMAVLKPRPLPAYVRLLHTQSEQCFNGLNRAQFAQLLGRSFSRTRMAGSATSD